MKRLILTLSLLASFSACLQDAERTNPLDPEGEQFQNLGVLQIQAQSIHSPPRPLEDVLFELHPASILRRTGSDGLLTFDGLNPGRYLVTGTKRGYAPVSDSVSVDLGKTNSVSFQFDGLPQITTLEVTTHHVSQWLEEDEEIFFMEIRALASDPDGINDIDFLRMEVPGLGLANTVRNAQSSGYYLWRLEDPDFPGGSIQQASGYQIEVTAVDIAGFEGDRQHTGLSRIILETPVANSPSGGEPIQPNNIILSWNAIEFPFEFTYEIEIMRQFIPGIFEPVFKREEISSDMTATTVLTSLAPGAYYYWTVSVVDEFGNWSRSRQAGFQVP